MADNVDSKSRVDQTSAGASTGRTGVGAQQEAAATGAGQVDVGAGSRVAGADAVADIGGPEAQTRSTVADTSMWIHDQKRTVEEFQQESLDRIRKNNAAFDEATGRNREIFDRIAQNAVNFDGQIQNIAIQALQGAVERQNRQGTNALSHDENIQSVNQTGREIHQDRIWNIDEVSLGAMSAVIATTVGKVLADLAKDGEEG